MNFDITKLLVEYIQNFPVILSTVTAIAILTGKLWNRSVKLAFVVIALGSIGSAALIEIGERYKNPTHVASWLGFLVNSTIFIIGGFIFVNLIPILVKKYPQRWSLYLAIVMALLAFVGGTLQGFGGPEPTLAIVHGIALAAGALCAFWPLNRVIGASKFSLLIAFVLFMNLLFSVPIYIIDYVLHVAR